MIRTARRLGVVVAPARRLGGCSLAARFHFGDLGVGLHDAGLAMSRIGSHVSFAITERRAMRRRDLVRTLGALVAAAAVAACGKKGRLELPPADEEENKGAQ